MVVESDWHREGGALAHWDCEFVMLLLETQLFNMISLFPTEIGKNDIYMYISLIVHDG